MGRGRSNPDIDDAKPWKALYSGRLYRTESLSLSQLQEEKILILMSEEKMNALNLYPLASIAFNTVVGSDPRLMLTGPVDV